MTESSTSAPLTAAQNAYASAASASLGLAAMTALTCPGAIVSGLVVVILWRLTRAPWTQRLLSAVASLALLAVVGDGLLLAWPWRLAGAGFVAPAALGLTPPGIERSLVAEMSLGPALALLTELGFAMRRRTLIGQVHVNAKRDQRRARALQPGYVGAGSSPALSHGDSVGMIHLGVDQNGDRVDLGVGEIAQHIFLPGATGSGKTTTIVRLASGALASGYAVAIIDGKGGSLGGDARRVALRADVPFAVVHPGEADSAGYDVCTGDAADVANKLIGAFSFSDTAEIYKQVAMQALPVVVKAIRAAELPLTLDQICEAFSTGGFAQLKRLAPEETAKSLDRLTESERDELARAGYSGMRYRLRALGEGKFGKVLERRPALDWDAVSSQPHVSYLGLPTTAAAEDVELLGRVIVQDLKQLCARRLSALGRRESVQPLLVIFDEFTALREAPQIRDLLLQSRQALMPTVVAQQYLPMDLEIRAAVLQSGVLLCHRLNSEDAEAIANEVGTRKNPLLTSQVNFETGEIQKGSIRTVDEYRIHPNVFRELPVGRAVLLARPSKRRAVVDIQRDTI